MHATLDIYTDYLICQNNYATATGLADLLCGAMSHDKFTRFLNGTALGSQDLWLYIKDKIRKNEKQTGGVLILDDAIEEKPYTDENEIMCWSGCKSLTQVIDGIVYRNIIRLSSAK